MEKNDPFLTIACDKSREASERLRGWRRHEGRAWSAALAGGLPRQYLDEDELLLADSFGAQAPAAIN